jgi:hypothetical protein
MGCNAKRYLVVYEGGRHFLGDRRKTDDLKHVSCSKISFALHEEMRSWFQSAEIEDRPVYQIRLLDPPSTFMVTFS